MEKKIKEGSCPACVEILALSGRALPKSEADVICPSCLAVADEHIKDKPITLFKRLRTYFDAPACLKRGG